MEIEKLIAILRSMYRSIDLTTPVVRPGMELLLRARGFGVKVSPALFWGAGILRIRLLSKVRCSVDRLEQTMTSD